MSVHLPKHANDTKICIGLFVSIFGAILCVASFLCVGVSLQVGLSVSVAFGIPVGFALLAIMAHLVVVKLEAV